MRLRGRLEGRRVVPYYSRAEIERGIAPVVGKEIVWVDDPIEAFFLQIQGSGRVRLPTGEMLRIGYADQNGHPYASIGRYLVDQGELPLEQASMQGIQAWARANPARVVELLNQNPSYVFFRMDMGPSLGNIGVPLTPGRSIATDSKLFPRGALAIISTLKPVIENGAIMEWVPFTRFVLNQDAGGAIKGPGRVDLFWGRGPEAEVAAGYMQQEGELYFLIRKK
jgi:membrane-bound lytic murein transglycosylase A